MENIISLSKITKVFGEKIIINDVNLDVNAGDYISIVGKSGAGKSTLMNILGLLDRNFKGTYSFKGKKLTPKEQNRFRNQHLGFIFQQFNLLPTLTARENVMLPYNYYKGEIADIANRCTKLFNNFGIINQIDQPVNTLSGGEKQRVALIRSIILNPEIILADEPTGNLDPENSMRIRKFLKEINHAGKTVIVVTHDFKFAEDAFRKLRIEGGTLYEYI